ncbi:MAG: PhoU domain-containing protein, partial [Halobaculum sp.]
MTGATATDCVIDDEADRLFALVSRQFQRSLTELDRVDQLDTTRGALFDHYYLCRQLERVADLAVDIAALVERQPHPPGEERETAFRALARDARNAVTEATSVTLADTSREAAFRARDMAADAISEADRLDRELYADSGEAYVWSKLLEKLTRTAEHGRNLAELGIRHCLRE